ncbi:hypothetical protein IAT38_007314 [Cryptococcus sp. DSM 104549]
MFPVPQHLPRAGGHHSSSESTLSHPAEDEPAPSPVLDLLQPLLQPVNASGPSRWNTAQVRGVREALEKAVKDNKAQTHELLVNNFPSVSSHIQLGASLKADYAVVKEKIEELEKQIDPSDPHTSFLPPLLSLLNKHFTSSSARTTSQGYIRTLKALSRHVERLRKLEEAVWAGQGADEWVVEELKGAKGFELESGDDGLKGTKMVTHMQAKESLLRSMITDQLTDGFNHAVALSTATGTDHGVTITVRRSQPLQQPRTSRPVHLSSSQPAPYPLSQLYTALSELSLLPSLLQTLQTRLLRDIITPLVSSQWRTVRSSTDELSSLRMEKSAGRLPEEVLEEVKGVLEFISSTILPSGSVPTVRETFISQITSSTFQTLLAHLILPSIPSSLSTLPPWISTLQHAVDAETLLLEDQPGVIIPFFQEKAGTEWAQQRRYGLADAVRRLVLKGWGGWEGVEKQKDREVKVWVEVEVSDDEESGWGLDDDKETKGGVVNGKGVEAVAKNGGADNGEVGGDADASMEGDGWGFDEGEPSKPPAQSVIPPAPEVAAEPEEEADGWDLDPSPVQSPPAAPSPPKPTAAPAKPVREARRLGKRVAKKSKEEEHDPWGSGSEWDGSTSAAQEVAVDPAPLPVPEIVTPVEAPKPAKPVREARRLGKKVAKRSKEEEHDPWGSGSEVSSVGAGAQNGHRVVSPPPPAHPAPIVKADDRAAPAPVDDGWGWDDDAQPQAASAPAPPSPKKRKRKELREEKKVVKDKFLVSTACEDLLGLAREVLGEVQELQNTSYPSPSFDSRLTVPVLLHTVTEIFDLYRAILPAHFSKQLEDVPALAMQAYNDANYLASALSTLTIPEASASDIDLADESTRLSALGEHIYEALLETQKAGIDGTLDDLRGLEGTGEDKTFKKCEKSLQGVVHSLESLAKILKPVLSQATRLEILGYLVTHLISRMSEAVLSIGDITEIESNRLTELLRLVYPLENLFGGEGGVVEHVRGWLKFCYIAEILQANLVDITYLLDQGALVDFTVEELVGLVRALFASSDKRDGVVERVEREGTGAASA